ncbi:hypothetical protein [Lacticaseibacillus kribbianus]|uniref:hypothetical protein n=1 Tax=Lacticaseibacillus kribbianus TaxID=2926292 RepID=UPI001CD3F153|nr:hypothetical protein [Lacticaseibacillus kribbianus]
MSKKLAGVGLGRELTRGRALCLGFADGTRQRAVAALGGGAWVGQQAPGGYGRVRLRLAATPALRTRLARGDLVGFGCGGSWYPLAWSPLDPAVNAAQTLQMAAGTLTVAFSLPAAYPVATVAAAAPKWRARQVAALAAAFPDWPQGLIAALVLDTAAQVVAAGGAENADEPLIAADRPDREPAVRTASGAAVAARGTLLVRPARPWWEVATPNQLALAWLPYAALARLTVTVAAADFWAGIAWLWWRATLFGVAPEQRRRPR